MKKRMLTLLILVALIWMLPSGKCKASAENLYVTFKCNVEDAIEKIEFYDYYLYSGSFGINQSIWVEDHGYYSLPLSPKRRMNMFIHLNAMTPTLL